MSSQRSRAPRNGPRGGSSDAFNSQEMWVEILSHIKDIDKGEAKAAANRENIIEGEERLAAKRDVGKGIPVPEIEAHDALFRAGLRLSEEQVARLKDGSLIAKLELLRDIMKNKEKEATAAETQIPARASSSRASNMDFEVPLDSPGPSPAENRQVRKLGASRTGSIPPKSATEKPDSTASEASERVSKPKVVYAVAEKVAFKRKQQGSKTDDQEWILGEVARVIGEGKSRRYEVTDPYPDPGGPRLYKSSASQMVPIPVEGSVLEDYEVGKRVLALYPDTSAFYRAEVKGTLEGGAKVQLLFEDEVGGELRIVERRLTLDHKG